MSKHTPGPWKPWKTSLARSGVPEYQIHWSDEGECVAEVVHGEADAHLIAAAPLMYEALEEVVNNAVKNFEGSMDIYPEAIAAARAALQTAKGGGDA